MQQPSRQTHPLTGATPSELHSQGHLIKATPLEPPLSKSPRQCHSVTATLSESLYQSYFDKVTLSELFRRSHTVEATP